MDGSNTAPQRSCPSGMLREAERLRELADQVKPNQPDHAAACVFAAAVIESIAATY